MSTPQLETLAVGFVMGLFFGLGGGLFKGLIGLFFTAFSCYLVFILLDSGMPGLQSAMRQCVTLLVQNVHFSVAMALGAVFGFSVVHPSR